MFQNQDLNINNQGNIMSLIGTLPSVLLKSYVVRINKAKLEIINHKLCVWIL